MIGSNLLSIATGFAPMPIVPTGWKMRILPGKDLVETLIPEGMERITDRMARDFLPFIRNHYDLITTAPPSARRCPARYCTHDLATAISRMAEIPFAPAFSRKTDKPYHGRHSSLSQSEPVLLPS